MKTAKELFSGLGAISRTSITSKLRTACRHILGRLSSLKILGEDAWAWFTTLPLVPLEDKPMQVNSFFSFSSLQGCPKKIRDMRHLDRDFRHHLDERGIRGIKLWEYSVLLDAVGDIEGQRVLDIGAGRSLFCLYLKKLRAEIVTFDLPAPLQHVYSSVWKKKKKHMIRHVAGDMRYLPFADGSFDLVLSISAIEHLQQQAKRIARPYDIFVKDTKQSLLEMARIVKEGGYLYITSEMYDPELHTGDRWWNLGEEIACAYKCDDFEEIFLRTFSSAGLFFDREYDYDFNLVREDPDRSNYRGRYITTFALLMKRG